NLKHSVGTERNHSDSGLRKQARLNVVHRGLQWARSTGQDAARQQRRTFQRSSSQFISPIPRHRLQADLRLTDRSSSLICEFAANFGSTRNFQFDSRLIRIPDSDWKVEGNNIRIENLQILIAGRHSGKLEGAIVMDLRCDRCYGYFAEPQSVCRGEVIAANR